MICSAFAEFRAECYAAIITTMVPITTQHESRMLLGARTEILRIKGEAECVSTAFHGVIAVVALDKTRMHPPICRRGRQKKKRAELMRARDLHPALIYGAVITRCCQVTNIRPRILATLSKSR